MDASDADAVDPLAAAAGGAGEEDGPDPVFATRVFAVAASVASGRLDRLLQGHRVLQYFATLSPEERETARVWVIYALKWEAIYDLPAAASSYNNLNS